jgi:hypothetical protein
MHEPAKRVRTAGETDRTSRAKQTLFNGYCGLPLEQQCRTPTRA